MVSPKVALVTGSGKRRVGAAIVEALAERGYGLAIHYRSSAADADAAVAGYRARGLNAIALQADLREEAAVGALIQRALDHFGRLDVLVNSAAEWQSQRLEEATAADVRRAFEINTLGTFLCAQRAGLAMVKQASGGCIVNVGDWATERPYLHHVSYFVSKGAIPALTRSLAVELGTRNPAVRVNCVLPGPVMLPEDMPADVRARVIDATLLRREGRPENVAQAVLFFIDNDFVTGVCLPVDGGRTIFAPDSAR